MGLKTFRFEDGAEKHEVQFNYSQDADAQALLDWFERITETEQHFINLDRTVHYDKLGVNDVLLQLQITWDHKRLVAPGAVPAACSTGSRRTKAFCTWRANAPRAWRRPSASLPASQEKTQ